MEATVHDVQPAAPRHSAADGHVSEREAHPREAARGVELPVRPQELRALKQGRRVQRRERPVQHAPRAGEARLQGLHEAVRQALRGVPRRRRILLRRWRIYVICSSIEKKIVICNI